jgi:hypothetical protein
MQAVPAPRMRPPRPFEYRHNSNEPRLFGLTDWSRNLFAPRKTTSGPRIGRYSLPVPEPGRTSRTAHYGVRREPRTGWSTVARIRCRWVIILHGMLEEFPPMSNSLTCFMNVGVGEWSFLPGMFEESPPICNSLTCFMDFDVGEWSFSPGVLEGMSNSLTCFMGDTTPAARAGEYGECETSRVPP